MRLSYRLILSLIAGMTAISMILATYQAGVEMQALRDDVARHALEVADSQQAQAETLLARGSHEELQAFVDRFQNHERLAGVALFDAKGQPVALTSGLASLFHTTPSKI